MSAPKTRNRRGSGAAADVEPPQQNHEDAHIHGAADPIPPSSGVPSGPNEVIDNTTKKRGAKSTREHDGHDRGNHGDLLKFVRVEQPGYIPPPRTEQPGYIPPPRTEKPSIDLRRHDNKVNFRESVKKQAVIDRPKDKIGSFLDSTAPPQQQAHAAQLEAEKVKQQAHAAKLEAQKEIQQAHATQLEAEKAKQQAIATKLEAEKVKQQAHAAQLEAQKEVQQAHATQQRAQQQLQDGAQMTAMVMELMREIKEAQHESELLLRQIRAEDKMTNSLPTKSAIYSIVTDDDTDDATSQQEYVDHNHPEYRSTFVPRITLVWLEASGYSRREIEDLTDSEYSRIRKNLNRSFPDLIAYLKENNPDCKNMSPNDIRDNLVATLEMNTLKQVIRDFVDRDPHNALTPVM